MLSNKKPSRPPRASAAAADTTSIQDLPRELLATIIAVCLKDRMETEASNLPALQLGHVDSDLLRIDCISKQLHQAAMLCFKVYMEPALVNHPCWLDFKQAKLRKPIADLSYPPRPAKHTDTVKARRRKQHVASTKLSPK
jgi:hypothetical protein